MIEDVLEVLGNVTGEMDFASRTGLVSQWQLEQWASLLQQCQDELKLHRPPAIHVMHLGRPKLEVIQGGMQ